MSDEPQQTTPDETASPPAPTEAGRPGGALRAAMLCLFSAVIGFTALAVAAGMLRGDADDAPNTADQPDTAAAEFASSVDAESNTAADPAGRRVSDATAEQIAIAIAHADQLLQEGNGPAAWRDYEWAQNAGELEGLPDLHFRMGLCAEQLGDFDRALSEYRLAAGKAGDNNARIAAQLGQARVWMGLGRADMAQSLLCDIWLKGGAGEQSPPIAARTAYTLANAWMRRVIRANDIPPWRDAGLLTPASREGDPTLWLQLYQSQSGAESNQPLPAGVHLAQRGFAEPDGIFLQVNLARLPVDTVIQSICQAAGFETTWTPAARQAAIGRTVQPAVPMASLAVLLDILTCGSRLSWSSSGETVQFHAESEIAPAELEARLRRGAARVATHAILQHPDPELSPGGYLALGDLAMLDGRAGEAAAAYQQLLRQFPRTPIKVEAWFNLAKAQLALDQRPQALDAFYHVVDNGTGHPAEAAGYLYIGRLILEDGDVRRAATQFMRSSVLAQDRSVRALAVLGLSASFLLSDNPAGADLVLMDHRSDLVDPDHHAVAALLGSAARYRAATEVGLKAREGRNLLAALAQVQPSEFFGSYGWFVMARSYDDLGLVERAAELRLEAVDVIPPVAFRAPMLMSLAEARLAAGPDEEGLALLQQLIELNDEHWSPRARVLHFEIMLRQGELQPVLQQCRARLPECTSDAEKRDLLRIMGIAYRSNGDFAAAAMCFAGSEPSVESTGDKGPE